MSKYIIQGETLANIADAIRNKNGKTDKYTPSEMADAINSLVDMKRIALRDFTDVVIENIGTLGAGAFYYCTMLFRARLDVISISQNAFYMCVGLQEIVFSDRLNNIERYAFYSCESLKEVTFPEHLTRISDYAFALCEVLTFTEFPASLRQIGVSAFTYCEGLTEITFKGTPETIAGNAFSNCANLTTINVPWAEGAVANAPWGATNATINYNYTGE